LAWWLKIGECSDDSVESDSRNRILRESTRSLHLPLSRNAENAVTSHLPNNNDIIMQNCIRQWIKSIIAM
jgi:hypothetical protein